MSELEKYLADEDHCPRCGEELHYGNECGIYVSGKYSYTIHRTCATVEEIEAGYNQGLLILSYIGK